MAFHPHPQRAHPLIRRPLRTRGVSCRNALQVSVSALGGPIFRPSTNPERAANALNYPPYAFHTPPAGFPYHHTLECPRSSIGRRKTNSQSRPRSTPSALSSTSRIPLHPAVARRQSIMRPSPSFLHRSQWPQTRRHARSWWLESSCTACMPSGSRCAERLRDTKAHGNTSGVVSPRWSRWSARLSLPQHARSRLVFRIALHILSHSRRTNMLTNWQTF